jgi:Centromere DNA-binding protein complex CBF3 subunit, domain 2
LFKCELSDLCNLVHDNLLIHVMQIATGKTNGLKTLYGQCIHHKNVNLCAIGDLGLYLLARSHQASEADGIQFKNNKKWFSIKLLIDSGGSDNTKTVLDQAYYNSMKDACKNLGTTSKHFVHFGRGADSVKAELDELD